MSDYELIENLISEARSEIAYAKDFRDLLAVCQRLLTLIDLLHQRGAPQ